MYNPIKIYSGIHKMPTPYIDEIQIAINRYIELTNIHLAPKSILFFNDNIDLNQLYDYYNKLYFNDNIVVTRIYINNICYIVLFVKSELC